MWGQVLISQAVAISPRIIPTRVGTRILCRLLFLLFEDHPHACGDKTRRCSRRYARKGSSPRVWGQVAIGGEILGALRIIPTRVGTRLRAEKSALFFRIIPTRVGTSLAFSICDFLKQDHPHACGDKLC